MIFGKFEHLLFYNTKVRRKKKKSKIETLKFENHHICTKSKKTKHFPWAINSTCLKHSFRTFVRIFVPRGNFRNDWHGNGAASQTNISCPGLVHNIFEEKRNFLNFYLRLKCAEAFSLNNASLSPNSTNSLLNSVKNFCIQIWDALGCSNDSSHEGERINCCHNSNLQTFCKIKGSHNKSLVSGCFSLFLSYVWRAFCAYC